MDAPLAPCPHCGAVHPPGLGGLCPQLLLGMGLEPPESWPEEPVLGEDGKPRRVGPYELVERIGRGGMGVIYKARHVELERVAALKMIAEAELASDAEVQALLSEARLVARLGRHPNIIPLYEVGEHEGRYYFAMMLMEGQSLAHQIERFRGHPREAARLQDPDTFAGRIVVESLTGAALGIGGMVFGSALVDFKFDSPSALISPMMFLVVGSAVGVSLSGTLMDGQGHFGYTLLGSAIGFVAPLVVGSILLANSQCAAASASRCEAITPVAISMLLLPTAGAIIAYEASSPRRVKSPGNKQSPRSPAPRVFPALAPARQGLGATLGIAGTL